MDSELLPAATKALNTLLELTRIDFGEHDTKISMAVSILLEETEKGGAKLIFDVNCLTANVPTGPKDGVNKGPGLVWSGKTICANVRDISNSVIIAPGKAK
jgi:hypothetical protein